METENPSPRARELCKLAGWTTLVVRNAPGRTIWEGDPQGCHFLSSDDQTLLGLEVFKVVSQSEGFKAGSPFSWKNLAYLYAIQHGAKTIYEIDDDRDLIGGSPLLLPEGPNGETCLPAMKTTSLIQNPLAHFGTADLFPKGFPADSLPGEQTELTYHSAEETKVLIQQGLTDGFPDLSLSLSPQARNPLNPGNFEWREPLAVRRGFFSPFDSQNTVFSADAFWALLLPLSAPFSHPFQRAAWRSYWAQRILWEIGGSLAFLPPTVRRPSPPKKGEAGERFDAAKEMMEELTFSSRLRGLIEFLSKEWKPSEAADAKEMLLDLADKMQEAKLWEKMEVDLVKAWVQDLSNLGYQFPSRKGNPSSPPLPIPCKQIDLIPEPSARDPSVFIAILSAPGEVGMRKAVRETWGKHLPRNWQLFFFTDGDNVPAEDDLIEMQGDEACTQHCHISFPRNTWIHRWAVQGPRYDYFLRLDGDAYLCVDHLLHTLSHAPRRRFFWAWFHCSAIVRGDEFFHVYSWDLLQFLATGFNGILPVSQEDRKSTFAMAYGRWAPYLNITTSVLKEKVLVRDAGKEPWRERCKARVMMHLLKEPEKIHSFHENQKDIPGNFSYPSPQWQTVSQFCQKPWVVPNEFLPIS